MVDNDVIELILTIFGNVEFASTRTWLPFNGAVPAARTIGHDYTTRTTISQASASGSSGLTGRREHEQADIHGTLGFRPALNQRPAGERFHKQMMNATRMMYLIRALGLQRPRQQDHQDQMMSSVQLAARDGQTLILAILWMRSVGCGVTTRTRTQASATQTDDDHHDHEHHDHHVQSRVLRWMSAASRIGQAGIWAMRAGLCVQLTTELFAGRYVSSTFGGGTLQKLKWSVS